MECKNCHNDFDITLEVCPVCGVKNPDYHIHTIETPKTIAELKIWYSEHGLPDESVTRFFIGKNINEPKNFGIYYDSFTGNYVVYKNKDTGARVIRYEGKDEAFAVKEFWLRLKSEIQNQKDHQHVINKSSKGTLAAFGIFIAIFLSFLFIVILVDTLKNRYNGYYHYNDHYYYSYSDDWYIYNDYGWTTTDSMDVIKANRDEYYLGNEYRDSYGVDDFKYTTYYDNYHSSSSDSSDWSSGDSWDSGGTDWGSDW